MIRRGKCITYGEGWFIAYLRGYQHVLFAIRPTAWRLQFVRPPGKPGYSRLYFGPFEIEWHIKSTKQEAKQ